MTTATHPATGTAITRTTSLLRPSDCSHASRSLKVRLDAGRYFFVWLRAALIIGVHESWRTLSINRDMRQAQRSCRDISSDNVGRSRQLVYWGSQSGGASGQLRSWPAAAQCDAIGSCCGAISHPTAFPVVAPPPRLECRIARPQARIPGPVHRRRPPASPRPADRLRLDRQRQHHLTQGKPSIRPAHPDKPFLHMITAPNEDDQ